MAEIDSTHAGADDAVDDKAVDDKKKVAFSAEQQEVVDALIDRVYGKGLKKATADIQPKLTEASNTIEALNKQILELQKVTTPKGKKEETAATGLTPEDAATKKALKVAEDERFQQLAAQMEEMRDAQKALQKDRDEARESLKKQELAQKNTQVKEEFFKSSQGLNFIDPTEVYSLVKDTVVFDEELGQVVVMNPKTGRPRMDSTLENPLTLEEYLSQWANDHRHHVRAADTTGGTGSAETRRLPLTKDSKIPDFAGMKPEDFEAYKNKVKMQVYNK